MTRAAVATAQPVAAPEPAEDIVDTDFQKFLAELAVTQAGVVVGQCTGQQLTEDLETLFTHICCMYPDWHARPVNLTGLLRANLAPLRRVVEVGF